MYMNSWRPLKATVDQTLVDKIPGYMFDPLADWVENVETKLGVEGHEGKSASSGRKSFIYDFDCLRHTRSTLTSGTSTKVFAQMLNIGMNPIAIGTSLLMKPPTNPQALMLDYIDFILSKIGDAANNAADATTGQLEKYTALYHDLDHILETAGSKWRIGKRNNLQGLVERVDHTMDEAADKAMSECGDAGELLAQAWQQLFGRDPNPTEAYNTTIRALDVAANPILSPNDAKATLGKSLSAMRDQHWRYKIEVEEPNSQRPDEAPRNVDGGVVQLMMRTILENHNTRHAGGEITNEQARAAIFLAVPAIQAFHDDLLTKAEKQRQIS